MNKQTSKHNELVAQLHRTNLKRDKAIETLLRIEGKRISLIRAIARSQKRLAKASIARTVNAPLPFDDRPDTGIPPIDVFGDDDSIPHFLRR